MGSNYEFKPSPYSSHSLLLQACGETARGRRVLDLGCGQGHLSRILAARGLEVVGVERAGGYGASAPEGVRIVEGDLEQGIPDVGGPFDVVLCGDILEHLKDPGRLLDQITTLLRPGGRLIASLPNSGNIYFRLTVALGRFPKEDRGLFDRTHLHFYTWDGWERLLGAHGFEVESVHPSGIPVGLAVPSMDGSLAIRAAERLCHIAARVWKRLFAYQFVVAARPVFR